MMLDAGRPRVSVVVPTYNRGPLLARLVAQLGEQSLDPATYELVVVDDGSSIPARTALAGLQLRCELRVEEQPNAGAAAARHRGATVARGDLLVFVDDDMQVGREFIAEHLRAHPEGSRRAVLGSVRPPADIATMPLFERWHQRTLEQFAEGLARRGGKPLGNNMYTGNVSLRRRDYVAVGGFDPTLGHSEDAELGLRLELAGVEFDYSLTAYTINGSDHTSLEKFRRRSELYGVFDCRIARKHAGIRHASPWRFWSDLNPVSRPILLTAALVPPVSRGLATLAYAAASGAARLGIERLAITGTTLTYGLDYYRGVRTELGSAAALLADFRAYRRSAAATLHEPVGCRSLLRRFVAHVGEDHAMVRHYEARYGHQAAASGRLRRDAVQKIGLQIMIAIRWMRFLRDARASLATKVVSRSIRHLYGADIHWDAELEPGIAIVHGMGLAISHAAHVSKGCILFQNVTLGMGTDSETGQTGAPRLEHNVHVGPGATLLGPITIGEGSKIQAGAVVTQSVPPYSVVMTPQPEVRSRKRPGAVDPKVVGTKPQAPRSAQR